MVKLWKCRRMGCALILLPVCEQAAVEGQASLSARLSPAASGLPGLGTLSMQHASCKCTERSLYTLMCCSWHAQAVACCKHRLLPITDECFMCVGWGTRLSGYHTRAAVHQVLLANMNIFPLILHAASSGFVGYF